MSSRSRYHAQILERLEGPLDPMVFEQCVCELLRESYPSLAAIPGGNDGGYDGAISDGEGEPLPLVTTTQTDAIENLTRSLRSVIKIGRSTRKAVFATSRSLTPPRRHNLLDRARELGFTLLNVHAREDLAERLYRRPDLTLKLLQIEGRPGSLSPIPRTRRPFLHAGIELVGREDDLRWLKETRGDRLLHGQPGSGKTFLLYQLASEGVAVFLESTNWTAVTEELLELEPTIVIVDDAHEDPTALEQLLRIREEVGSKFDVIACTWNYERDSVSSSLRELPSSRVRGLELMSRSDILQVYQRCGVVAPEDHLRELVTLAANKPGLAATFAHLYMSGDGLAVLRGERITEHAMTMVRRLVGRDAETIVACYALGGDRGTRMDAVAGFLRRDVAAVRSGTIALGAAGILSETGPHVLSVWPRTLRSGFLRTVFFSEGCALPDVEGLLDRVEDRGSGVEAIARARLQGAQVPSELLRRLVLSTEKERFGMKWRSERAWNDLAAFDRHEAEWVLENYPGSLVDVARTALQSNPEWAIPRILIAAVHTHEPITRRNRLIQILTSWVEDLEAGEELVARRKLLAKSARDHLLAGNDSEIGFQALALAFSPELKSAALDPGAGRTLTLHSGTVPVGMIHEFDRLWPEYRELLSRLDSRSGSSFLDLLHRLLHPRRSASLHQDYLASLRAFGSRLAADLAHHSAERLGLTTALRRLLASAEVELPIAGDPVFERLFPTTDAHGMPPTDPLQDIADSWALRPPAEVARELASYESEARAVNLTWPRRTPELAALIAKQVDDPEAWLRQFVPASLPSILIEPFLARLVSAEKPGWEVELLKLLNDTRTASIAVSTVLTHIDAPPDLLDAAITIAGRYPGLIESHTCRMEIPHPSLRALLKARDWFTALAAAIGSWLAQPRGEIADSIRLPWREAILRAQSTEQHTELFDFWLKEILTSDAQLAYEWLRHRLLDEAPPQYVLEGHALLAVLSGLSSSQRAEIVRDLPLPDALVPHVVNGDAAAYALFVARPDAVGRELIALKFFPDDRWMRLARLALYRGHDPEEIAAVVRFARQPIDRGSADQHWQAMRNAFSRMEDEPDLREVAIHAGRLVSLELERRRKRDFEDELGSHN